MAARSAAGRPARANNSPTVSVTHPSTASGPLAMSSAARVSARIWPDRSESTAMACVAPTSTPATTRTDGLSANSEGGRPPVERASP